jgi:hypothetical protein
MHSDSLTTPVSKAAWWTSWILSGLLILFLAFDGVGKVLMIEPVKKACAELGITESVVPGIGAVLIGSTILYAIPATSILGAILLTGYLGGAISTHVRLGGPAFPIVFASILGVLVWLALVLREPRLRSLIPLRR